MNNPTNFHSINKYAKEPYPSTSTASSPATTAYSTDGDSQRSTSSQRSKTLKARIKRNMLNDSIKLSATSTASAPPSVKGDSTTKECPVFEAASALASLGVNSPMSSFNGGQGGGAVKENMTMSNTILSGSGSYASAQVPSATVNPSASFMGQQQQHPLLSVIQPHLSLTLQGVLSQQVNAARPFASLIGSDVPLTFPQKLMEVLANPEISDIITWLPHGKGFIILNKRRFATEVMPLYFKHSLFTSFTRKLNRWGFTRCSRGPEMGAYFHKNFQRGDNILCMHMHCQNPKSSSKDSKATKGTSTPSIATSPVDKAKEPSQSTDKSPSVKASPAVVSAMPSIQVNASSATQAVLSKPSLPNLQPNTLIGASEHGYQQHLFQLVQSTGKVKGTAQEPLQPSSPLQACLTRSHHLQSMGKLAGSSNANQAVTIQTIIGANTLSSRNHQDPHVANSLNALKSRHNQALLTALTASMGQANAKNVTPQNQGVSNNTILSHAHHPFTSFQAQRSVTVSLGQQQQQANQCNQGITTPTSQVNSNHAIMLAKMKQLSESNRDRTIGLATAGLGIKLNPTNGKATIPNMMTQSDVAQLCNEIAARRQQHGNGLNRPHRAVRRASAA